MEDLIWKGVRTIGKNKSESVLKCNYKHKTLLIKIYLKDSCFVGGVTAGIWRRDGDSLGESEYYYNKKFIGWGEEFFKRLGNFAKLKMYELEVIAQEGDFYNIKT